MRTRISSLAVLVSSFCALTSAFSARSIQLSKGSAVSSSSGKNKNSFSAYRTLILFGLDNDDLHQEEPQKSRKVAKKSEKRNPEYNTYASGEDLLNLRQDLESLKHNLQWAEALKDETRVKSLQKAIEKGEKRDPDLMYSKALKYIAEAKKMKDVTPEEKDAFVEKWVKVAASARESLQQFNLEGLWVGNYGEHGVQVVNITYSDDTIIARKVTGDKNVPRGETTFTADLSPKTGGMLPPIQLKSDRRTGEFKRFPGRGQVSRSGFKDNRFVEGQLILFEKGFSFVWVPTKHHVLFQRATPEMTIRLLRDTYSQEDELENSREHIARCFDMDMTTCLARQHDPTIFEPIRRITPQEELDEVARRFKQENEKNIFWQVGKWRKYIDQALDKE